MQPSNPRMQLSALRAAADSAAMSGVLSAHEESAPVQFMVA
jgi:hypothetical protein